MLQREVLVSESVAVDRLPSLPVADREVAALNHEPRDDPMERGPRELYPLLSRAECAEILHCLGHHVAEEAERELSLGLLSDRDSNLQGVGDLLAFEVSSKN